MANNSGTPPEDNSKGISTPQGMSHGGSARRTNFWWYNKHGGKAQRRLTKNQYVGMLG
jgi:hypothetical protein